MKRPSRIVEILPANPRDGVNEEGNVVLRDSATSEEVESWHEQPLDETSLAAMGRAGAQHVIRGEQVRSAGGTSRRKEAPPGLQQAHSHRYLPYESPTPLTPEQRQAFEAGSAKTRAALAEIKRRQDEAKLSPPPQPIQPVEW